MRILVVGATGTIGREIVAALSRDHEVLRASRKSSAVTVDISSSRSIEQMYHRVGQLDAVVVAAGDAKFAPLADLTEDDFTFSLRNKLMGQVNLVRLGFGSVRDRGSFTVTSGILSKTPAKGSGAVSLVNAAVEGFARAAALEAPRGIRVNVVSPPWVEETLKALKMDPSQGLPAAKVARSYVESVTGSMTGTTLQPRA